MHRNVHTIDKPYTACFGTSWVPSSWSAWWQDSRRVRLVWWTEFCIPHGTNDSRIANCSWMNTSKKPSYKEQVSNFINAWLLPKLPPTVRHPKLVYLASRCRTPACISTMQIRRKKNEKIKWFRSSGMLRWVAGLLTLRLLMSYMYGAPSKARNTNVVYIYGPTFGNAETVSFYLLHNVSTLNQCREVSCHICV